MLILLPAIINITNSSINSEIINYINSLLIQKARGKVFKLEKVIWGTYLKERKFH